MGLDMYLTGKIHVGANYEHNNVSGVVYITKRGKEIDIPLKKVTDICIDLGYWRKANSIHGYIVDNFADGVDDCKEIYISKQGLNQLLDQCKIVLANPDKAEELLPVTAGFFFGSDEYNEYYFQDINDTINIIESALKHENVSYYYQASW
jgi:hypothetical protein